MGGVKGRSGGARPGAGRRPLTVGVAALMGGALSRTATGRLRPIDAQLPGQPLPCPPELAPAAAEVWREWAPLAHTRGTLTKEMAPAFELLCIQAAAERVLRASERAWSNDHRATLQRVELGMARFCLQPSGRSLTPAEAPKDEWAEFDGTAATDAAPMSSPSGVRA